MAEKVRPFPLPEQMRICCGTMKLKLGNDKDRGALCRAERMDTMSYIPHPLDTGDVKLPEELLELTEKIAENVHDIWAQGRIAEGWRYGPAKDAVAKCTPLLIPYGELPESEKQYDRNTALETLKLIVKLGYRIEKETRG